MPDLQRILRDLGREIDRVVGHNRLLEKRLEAITGFLQTGGAARVRKKPLTARTPSRGGGRRGAPPRFTDEQAVALRKEYEKGATGAELAKKHGAALPTILSTLRRVGTPLRRGRRKKR